MDSTTANTTEEDDEDATISTDTCLSVGDQELQQWPLKTTLDLNSAPSDDIVPSGSSCITSTIPDSFPFGEPMFGRGDSLDGVKVDRRVRGSCIARQISLYEKESRTVEAKHMPKAHECCDEGHKVESGESVGSSCAVQVGRQHQYPYNQHHHPQMLQMQTLHMSFDELRKEFPNNERSAHCHQEHPTNARSKEEPNKSFLKSLASLTVSQQRALSSTVQDVTGSTPSSIHTPGALVIREGYIEPPRLTRVTKSFHGKTDHQKLSIELPQDAGRFAVDVGGGLRRASDSPTVETNHYNKSAHRQQHSSAGISSSQGRFKTSIVQESEQLNKVDKVQASSQKPEHVSNLSLPK